MEKTENETVYQSRLIQVIFTLFFDWMIFLVQIIRGSYIAKL